MKAQQTIAEGSKVRFNSNGLANEFGEDVTMFENKIGTATLATYTELGDQDYEYYDIEFKNGELYAVSGYHLTVCK